MRIISIFPVISEQKIISQIFSQKHRSVTGIFEKKLRKVAGARSRTEDGKRRPPASGRRKMGLEPIHISANTDKKDELSFVMLINKIKSADDFRTSLIRLEGGSIWDFLMSGRDLSC